MWKGPCASVPMTRAQLTCQELVELVTSYLDDALSSAERARFDEHLTECPDCVTHLEQMRTTLTVVGRLSPETLDPDVEHALLAAFRGWARA